MEEDAFERKRLSENRRPSPVAVAPSEELPDSAAWEMKGFRRPDLMIRVFWGKYLRYYLMEVFICSGYLPDGKLD